MFFIVPISYSTLNRDLKKALRSGELTESQLSLVYDKTKAGQEQKRKTVRIVSIVLGVIWAVMMGFFFYTQIQVGIDWSLMAFVGLATAGIMGFALLLTYFAQVGILRGQFNRAVKKGYPELADLYKL